MPPKDSTPRAIRFGVNYTPSKRWYYCWNDWNLREIEEDFDAIASLGADHIRVQLIWPYFQPNPTFVSPGHLDRLRQLMRAADARGLDVLLSLLTGFLSGYMLMPPFVRERRDTFVNADVFAAEVLFARAAIGVARVFPNFMGIDVGNEINCIDHDVSARDGDAWAVRFLDAIRPELGGRLAVNGIDHTPLLAGSTFSLRHLATAYPVTCIHAWPLFTGSLEKGPLDGPPSTHIASFFMQLLRLHADDPARPMWIQEFGACDPWGTAAQRAAYMERGIELAIREGARLFTWWCSHDKTRDVKFDEFEYHYGLFTPDNRPKDLVETYRRTVARFAHADPAAFPPAHDCRIVVPEGFAPVYTARYSLEKEYMKQTLASSTWNLFDVYLEQVKAGRRPVLARDDREARPGDAIVRPAVSALMP